MSSKWYFGPTLHQSEDNPIHSQFVDIAVFKSEFKPTFKSHGDTVRYCFGGYITKRLAFQWAHYQFPVIRRFIEL